MADLSKQDVQSIVDGLRNTLIQKMGTRQDQQVMSDASRDRILLLLQQQSQLLKQMNYQNIQFFRRVVAIENRMTSLEYQLKAAHQSVLQVAEQQPERIMIPVTTDQPGYTQQHVYRPA